MGPQPPPDSSPSSAEAPTSVPVRRLAGGIVAHNEEGSVEAAIWSLLGQDLPEGTAWNQVWVVASGCTDRTVDRVERCAQIDSRIRLIVEPERRGKSTALDIIYRHAEGDALVLLNSDARAEPGAVRAMLVTCVGRSGPYAVMARPVPPCTAPGPVQRLTTMMWSLHHEFHALSLGSERGNHLSDELLLVSLPWAHGLPQGVINDGAYVGAWLEGVGGDRLYAPEARVAIQVPRTLGDHLTQRRRILVGHAQTGALLGTPPSTLPRLALRDPKSALRVVWTSLRGDPRRWFDLSLLVLPELLAAILATWDRLPPRRDHTRWQRIERPVVG